MSYIYDKLVWSEQEVAKIKKRYSGLEKDLGVLNEKSRDVDEAISILTAVLSITQEEVVQFIREIVSMSLKYVYGDEYDFRIKFELKRNQPELILAPMKNGKELDPKYGCGVGVVDVCAFSLRLAIWSLCSDKSSPVLIFDEPFRNVHGKEENERLAEMVANLSGMLGLQIIIVSGENALKGSASKIFKVQMVDGESLIFYDRGDI
jgi:DNA repair exonuclease SbcCD ATPase subunit